MPVFHPTAKRFQGFSISDFFAGSLPPADTGGGVWNPALQKLHSADNWKLHFESAEFIARSVLIRTATTAGVMKQRKGALRAVFSLVPKSGANFEGAAVGALAPALEVWSNALSGAFSRVPVVGWVFSLAELAYRFVSLAMKHGGERSPESPPVEGFAYNKPQDDLFVRSVIGETEGQDWTRVFLPPSGLAGLKASGVPSALSSVAVDWTRSGEGQGRRFTFSDAGSSPGLGLIPGLADCSTGGWEYPRKVWGSSRPAGRESLVFQADTLPALRQCALLMWQGVLKNSSRMFTVDTRRVISEWEDYFGALQAWAIYQRSKGRGQLAQMAEHAGRWRWDEGGGRMRSRYDRFDPAKLTIGDGMGQLIRHIVKTQLEASQRPALRTLTCAYVSPEAPAFRGRPKLARYHERMREKLLKHPARFEVELDMVPDKAYRDRVRAATVVPLLDFTAGGSSKPSRVDGVAAVDDGGDLPPDDDVEPGIPGGLGESGGGGMGWALFALATAATAAAVMRK